MMGVARMSDARSEHEAFVSNHTGSDLPTVAMTSAILPLSLILLHMWNKSQENATKSTLWTFLTEFVLICIPIWLSFAAEQSWTTRALVVLCLTVFLKYVWSSFASGNRQRADGNAADLAHLKWLNTPRRPFLDFYRGGLMLMTCLAILAVDFTIFPRYHAKTETFGISLMDVGVGTFVLSAGAVSAQAKPDDTRRSSSGEQSQQQRQYNIGQRLRKSVLAAIPLLVLGGVRFVTVKASDYQEHVSEYGVHWNFFLTLAVVALAVALLRVPPRFNLLAGTIIVAVHEGVLSLGAADYILTADRTSSFFAANREGIISSAGYVGLFFLGAAIGRECRTNRKSLSEWKLFLSVLWSLQAVTWLAASMLDRSWAPYSRRMVNVSYVVAILALSLQSLAMILSVCIIFPPRESLILSAVNYNGLAVFLGANLLTGAVNLSMTTITAPSALAFAILSAYLLLVTGISTILFKQRILLKFW